MALENPRLIDAIGIETATGYAVLTIVDSWEWSDESAHLCALQDKLNAYFEFIESGQILESYPNAQNRQVVVDIITRCVPSLSGDKLIKHAMAVASQIKVIVRHQTL